MVNKFSLLTHNSEVPARLSFFNFLMLHQKWPSATRGLAKSDYKTNKVLGMLLHVGEPLKPIN
jgi:hypothetical protein